MKKNLRVKRATISIVAIAVPLLLFQNCSQGFESPERANNSQSLSTQQQTSTPNSITSPNSSPISVPSPLPNLPIAGCPNSSSEASVGIWRDVSPSGFHSPSNVEAQAVAVTPTRPGWVYASGSNTTNGGNPTKNTGLLLSKDCGATWKQISTGRNRDAINNGMNWAIKVDFQNPQNIYVAVGYGAASLYRSTNGGVDWDDLFEGGKKLTVPGSPNGTLAANRVFARFVQAIGMDFTDPKHLVITLHVNCFNDGDWGTINQGPGIQCLGETLDGGNTWRMFKGPRPSEGWSEAASMTVLNHSTFIYTSSAGSYYTADSGNTYQELPFGSTSGGYSAGVYFAPNGKLYAGAENIWVSQGSPLGAPSTWTMIANSPKASTITSDGTTFYASFFNDFGGQPFYSAPMSNPTQWTHMNDPSHPGHGSNVLETDMTYHVVYSATGVGGIERLITSLPSK